MDKSMYMDIKINLSILSDLYNKNVNCNIILINKN